MLSILNNEDHNFHIKQLNQEIEESGISEVSTNAIKTIINFWTIKKWAKRKNHDFSKNHFSIILIQEKKELQEKFDKRREVASFIINYLFNKISEYQDDDNKDRVLIEFSVFELKVACEKSGMFATKVSNDIIEDTLFYLSRIDALKIEGGFLVIYNKLTIERLEKNNKRRYKSDDYKKLNLFYENKIQQIHIVGEYAKKMINDYKDAVQFVEDYFQLNYSAFLYKYFKGSRQNEIKRNITPRKFRELFGTLSPAQLKIINDQSSKNIVVAAGPGSGKTKLLVHKLASLLLMEDVKHEQLLMITFSRAAATEFKKRLLKLIGNAANFIEIKTFHLYCFDLLGKVGDLEKSDIIIQNAIAKIKSNEVEINRITKTVLVIDEAQDMDYNEYELILTLMEYNKDMRVIAVGDDDQNIYEFRGASSKYLYNFINVKAAVKYELVENYRSKKNLVEFTNQFVANIYNRLKRTPISAIKNDNGMLKIVKHLSNQMIIPIVNDVINSALPGSTCILSKTNDEALQVTGLLIKNGFHAKLIQTNEGFNLYNLNEIKFFAHKLYLNDDVFVINDEVWNNAKYDLVNRFSRSSKLELAINIIKDFELSNPKRKYKSDFEIFLRESKLEDFAISNIDTVIVSTIHKAKGKEFDNVYLMLNDVYLNNDSVKRELYVAMTRAKNNLTIHLNNNIFDDFNNHNIRRITDKQQYEKQESIILQLTHKGIWLDFFINNYRQNLINKLQSGDKLMFKNNSCYTTDNKEILKFSKAFVIRLEKLKQNGYEINSVKINFIIFWQKENNKKEVKIILPEIYLNKNK